MNFISTGYQIPEDEYYRQISVSNSNVIICQNCGTWNHLSLYQYGNIQGLIFCWTCGKEI